MVNCVRCGQGICCATDKVAVNKCWHRNCFNCYKCNKHLEPHCAKIYCGEIFCECCLPCRQKQQICKPVRVCSVTSFAPEPCTTSPCCGDYCREVHSSSCIPICYNKPNLCEIKMSCSKPKCSHRSRRCSPCPKRTCYKIDCPCVACCPSPTCIPCPPKRFPCDCYARKKCCYKSPCDSCDPCEPCRRCKPYVPCDPCGQCGACNSCSPCSRRCSPCRFSPRNCRIECCTPRCRRCGDKVYAAEKIITSCGTYHVCCFNCYCCTKSLDVKTMYEACGEIYCKQCYNNHFGMNHYGYCHY